MTHNPFLGLSMSLLSWSVPWKVTPLARLVIRLLQAISTSAKRQGKTYGNKRLCPIARVEANFVRVLRALPLVFTCRIAIKLARVAGLHVIGSCGALVCHRPRVPVGSTTVYWADEAAVLTLGAISDQSYQGWASSCGLGRVFRESKECNLINQNSATTICKIKTR